MTTEKADQAIARADRVMRQLDERDGAVRSAARRERQRLNAGLGRALGRAGIAILLISMVTILIGLLQPIGMFGFLAAVGLAIGAAVLMLAAGRREIVAPDVSAGLPNGQMVQRFDSYLFRSRRLLPAPAQAELDRLSAQLPAIRQTLERVPDVDPDLDAVREDPQFQALVAAAKVRLGMSENAVG